MVDPSTLAVDQRWGQRPVAIGAYQYTQIDCDTHSIVALAQARGHRPAEVQTRGGFRGGLLGNLDAGGEERLPHCGPSGPTPYHTGEKLVTCGTDISSH